MRHFLSAVCFLVLLASCKKIEDPVFNSISNIKVDKLGIGTTSMTFDVHCFNPNNKKAKLKEANGEAWIDSNYVGQFYVDTTINVPAKADFIIPVKLNMDMKFFLGYFRSGLKKEEALVTIKGSAKVGKGGIYKKIKIDHEAKYNLAQMIK